MRASRRRVAERMAQALVDEPTRRKQWLKRLAAELIERKATGQAHLYLNEIAAALYRDHDVLYAEVESARKLSSVTKAGIERHLQRQTGAKKVLLSESLRPDLIGGVIVRTPEAQYDASVANGIRKLAAIAG